MPAIIYPDDSNHAGGVTFVYPCPNSPISITETARKDVPAGKPYKIVQDSDLPTDADYEFFEAFEYDFSSPDGTAIGQDAWWKEQEGK
jgi:hypothetical protein